MRARLNLQLFPPEPAIEAPGKRAKAILRPARAIREPPHIAPLPRASAQRLWLALHFPQLALEHAQLSRLAAWCQQQFTPLVSLEPPDELLLEVKGSLQLFGGAQGLVKRISAGLREQGVTARLALTPTPRSSLWLARHSSSPSSRKREEEVCIATTLIERISELPRHLAAVSLNCLRWPEETLVLLLSMGVRTVGDLVRLPRAGLARRLGAHWLDELDRAHGRQADVRRGFVSPTRFDERCVPEHEIETAEELKSTCEPLLERLQQFLRKRQAAVGVIGLELKHRAHPLTRLRIGLALPSGDVGHLQSLLAERLRLFKLPAPVIAIRLRSAALLPAMAISRTLSLTPSARFRERAGMSDCSDVLPRLVERLRARLGSETVFGVCTIDDHRPEWACRAIEAGAAPSPQPSPQKGERGHENKIAKRPLWLVAQPQVIFASPLAPKKLRGPERIETGWWDGREVARDYFDVRDAQGARLWVFRERCAPHGWYLHGLYG